MFKCVFSKTMRTILIACVDALLRFQLCSKSWIISHSMQMRTKIFRAQQVGTLKVGTTCTKIANRCLVYACKKYKICHSCRRREPAHAEARVVSMNDHIDIIYRLFWFQNWFRWFLRCGANIWNMLPAVIMMWLKMWFALYQINFNQTYWMRCFCRLLINSLYL